MEISSCIIKENFNQLEMLNFLVFKLIQQNFRSANILINPSRMKHLGEQ